MFTRKLKKAALATAITASLGAGSVANASVIDNPIFQVLGAVVVWGSDGGTGLQVNDFIINDGTSGGSDLIGSDVLPLVTGTLTQYNPSPNGITINGETAGDLDGNGSIDASEMLTEFLPSVTLPNNPSNSQSSSFYVASNTAFNISAIATGDPSNLAAIQRAMTVTTDSSGSAVAFGTEAQIPDDGTPTFGIQNDGLLTAISGASGTPVYIGNRQTALNPGSIAEQSVQFTNTYTVDPGAFGLDQGPQTVSATITYTVAIP